MKGNFENSYSNEPRSMDQNNEVGQRFLPEAAWLEHPLAASIIFITCWDKESLKSGDWKTCACLPAKSRSFALLMLEVTPEMGFHGEMCILQIPVIGYKTNCLILNWHMISKR